MDVYLKNEKEKDTFHFPVNPFSITVNRNKRYETAEILDVGEIDFSDNSKKVKEISFETVLPKEYDSYCRYISIPDPIETIKKLEKWMEQIEPVRLIITNFDFNDLVIISYIKEDERPGEEGDKYISIAFRTWRELTIETIRPPTKISGYIQLRNNRPNINSSASPKYTRGQWVVITASILNVRNGPGTNHDIIGKVKNGESYKIGRVQGNWADIYWGSSGGWICTDYVK